MNTGYTLHKELRFEVCEEEFSVIRQDEDTLYIAETRKNGQEDSHMCGLLILSNNKWIWESDFDREQFCTYGSEEIANAIPAYINAHPIPDIDKL